MQAVGFSRTWRAGFALVCIVVLASCAVGPPQRDAAFEAALRNAAAFLPEDPVAAATAYESLAETVRGELRSEALLAAAEAWLTARRPDAAARALADARPLPPTGPLAARALLVAAELDLAQQNPRQALLRLERDDAFTPELQDRAIHLRGRALYQLGATLDATLLLNRQLQTNADPAMRLTNGRLIWRGLSRAREPLSLENLPPDTGAAVRGWIALGRIGQSAWQDPYGFFARLDDWAQRYPGHPATATLLDEIRAEHQRRFAYPDTIALLLPLSGRYQAAAETVRDGFLAGLYQHAQHLPPPHVRVFDTGADPAAALAAAQQAVLNGADILIGPLTKEALAAVGSAADIALPILGLNYLDPADMTSAQPGLVQFGLLPEDEAIQVAERSIAEGYVRGAALIPDNEFGLRMLAAFRARFEELGGEILTVQRYRPGETDYSTPIMRLLNLDASRLRHQQLRAILGQSLEFEPRRRQDVQFLFLAAGADEARLIRPQLRFHRAIDLPVYATSHVYRPGQPDRDLDDIRFADMPWILAPDAVGREARDTVAELWPGRFERNGRLYALGFDAFRLVPLLMDKELTLSHPLPAMTGLLSVDAQQRVRRDLYWARFAGGRPRLLPAIEEPLVEDPSANSPAQGTVHVAPPPEQE